MLKKIMKFLKALNSNTHPGEIAHAVCLGIILGFMPKTNLLWYLLTIGFLFMRINRGTLFISTVLFSLLAPVCDSLFDTIGYWVLNISFMGPVFSKLLDIPLLGFTMFNNSIVAGALIFSLLIYVPVYFISRLFTKCWRSTIAPYVRKTKLMTFLSKLPLIVKIGEKL
ncbi:MAG: TIGR03546 family protein [Treponema sp.]|nr:TIGR03546 family protein [Treponema sp.]